MKIKTRFAPSPTGYLHVGGARTALYSLAFLPVTTAVSLCCVLKTPISNAPPRKQLKPSWMA
ncbi:glutamate--tRNA ligase family protein [Klebsiella pneumoniae subsp. pneumoniae]|nr:glutamate--tRNA ligase family protein [Klebsiella pneumoniae subsp. pneumoniae]